MLLGSLEEFVALASVTVCVCMCVCVGAHLGSGTSYQQGPAGMLAVRL